jgi:hypothetical protein
MPSFVFVHDMEIVIGVLLLGRLLDRSPLTQVTAPHVCRSFLRRCSRKFFAVVLVLLLPISPPATTKAALRQSVPMSWRRQTADQLDGALDHLRPVGQVFSVARGDKIAVDRAPRLRMRGHEQIPDLRIL